MLIDSVNLLELVCLHINGDLLSSAGRQVFYQQNMYSDIIDYNTGGWQHTAVKPIFSICLDFSFTCNKVEMSRTKVSFNREGL